MSDFEIVERCTDYAPQGRQNSPVTVAVLETAKTGKAVRIALNGRTRQAYANQFLAAGNRQSPRLKACVRKVDDAHIDVWMEPR